jgi:anti-sigma factor RsiW
MATAPEQRLNPEERANLVAYIDGELTDAESRAIATKLTQSATARREVESLKKTWDLLEYLPRPAASAEFSQGTLTAIQGTEAQAGAWARDAGSWLQRAASSLIVLAAAAALALTGFAVARWGWPDPADRLARDLSLAEHLEEYQEVGSFRLLEELVQSSEFGSPRR